MTKYKYLILGLVAAAGLTIVVWAIVKHRVSVHHAADPIANAIIKLNNPVPVRQIDVIAGDEFDLTLVDGRRIHAMLTVKSPPIAKPQVLDFINRCKNPRVVLQQQEMNGVWIVDFYLTAAGTDGSEIEVSLAKWLADKNLAYQ